MAAGASDGKDILYAKQRGLPDGVIRREYLLRSIAQPFLTMLGMSVSLCVGGSVVIEKIFSIGGMGSLLTEAVYTLDYPLMQGILFVTTCIMVLSLSLIHILEDPVQPQRTGLLVQLIFVLGALFNFDHRQKILRLHPFRADIVP